MTVDSEFLDGGEERYGNQCAAKHHFDSGRRQEPQLKIPQNQKFDVNGKMVGAFGVRKAMIITATKIVEEPPL
jgi:hypothetical protein